MESFKVSPRANYSLFAGQKWVNAYCWSSQS